MPSPSGPLRRPSCSLRPVRCAPGARVSAGACGRTRLQRSWSQSHLQHTLCGLEPCPRRGAPRRRKERAYPELARAHRCRLVVLAVEVGGRWSDEAASFIRSLARARALEAPARLRPSVVSTLVARWSARLTHAAFSGRLPGRSFAMPGVAPCLPSAPCWLILPTCHWRAHPACLAGEPHSREPPVYPKHIRGPPVYKWPAGADGKRRGKN